MYKISPILRESQRASEGLIPQLGGGDAADDVLTVAHVEIELGEALLLRQRVRGVDTEVRRRPRRVHSRRTVHLNAPPDAQAIGQARLERGGHVERALALDRWQRPCDFPILFIA